MKKKYKIGEKVTEIYNVEVKSIDEEKFTLEAIFSTKNEDRHGDVVEQDWVLKNFKKNPVILNSHNYNDAVEVVGKASKVKVVDNKLQGTITFAVKENPKAKIIFDLFVGGFLNAFSVGFIPLEFDKDYKILKSELLEVSVVSVPANAEALAKAKGIDVDKLYVKENIEDEEDNGDTSGDIDGDEDTGEEDKPEDNKSKRIQKDYDQDWDETNENIRYKVRDIALFERPLEKVTLIAEIPRVQAMIGTLLGDDVKAIQMLFFPKDDGWTFDDAKKWFASWQISLLYGSKKFNVSDDFEISEIKTEKKVKTSNQIVSSFLEDKIKTEKKVLMRAKSILENVLNVEAKTEVKKNDVFKAVRSLLKEKGIK